MSLHWQGENWAVGVLSVWVVAALTKLIFCSDENLWQKVNHDSTTSLLISPSSSYSQPFSRTETHLAILVILSLPEVWLCIVDNYRTI